MTLANDILRLTEELGQGALDPNFFDNNNRLLPNIVDVLREATDDVMNQLAAKGVNFTPVGVILTGSLTSVNWDAGSDVDFHILVDYKQFPDPELMKNFLQYFAKNFNGRYDLKGRDLELYFQDADEPHVSPGIYDVLKGTWLMPPAGIKIEKTPEMFQAANNHLARIQELQREYNDLDHSNKLILKTFMTKVQEYFEALRKMRKDGIANDGLASVGNQVFKMLRRNGALELLTTLINVIQDDIYEEFK